MSKLFSFVLMALNVLIKQFNGQIMMVDNFHLYGN